MVHPYVVNTINALVLLIAGLTAYFVTRAPAPAALLAPAFGVALLACTRHLRKHNQFVINTVTALTLIAGFTFLLYIDFEGGSWKINDMLYLLMGISCFVAAVFYTGTFLSERRKKDNTIYKDDL
ncbi:hypothetical protein FVR03_01885 [Pontibacter qinzhouensis]|uniref:Uncharacterized protein n=1 Tax=Pontibacter qinzhouensis TaxID=2603253 RepID=A0A5C8KEU3_9BACT|nr:hypothetical protein [Pontibacter qinzhouensis]TXK52194.1 hypothetical protein FVR03_01885 [Pontibacter qinzhouensis]